ncbi:hypothetical protein ACLOJK_032824 [Asimina triloba]
MRDCCYVQQVVVESVDDAIVEAREVELDDIFNDIVIWRADNDAHSLARLIRRALIEDYLTYNGVIGQGDIYDEEVCRSGVVLRSLSEMNSESTEAFNVDGVAHESSMGR